MFLHRPRIGRLVLFTAALAVAGAGPFASAQDDEETEDKIEANPREQPFQPFGEAERLQSRLANKANVDRWVAIQIGSPGRFQEQLEKRLAHRLDELKIVCALTAAQATKLELAGRGDIKRAMDRLDQIVKRLENAQGDPSEFRIATVEIQEVRSAGLFGKDSLLSKTSATTVSAEQAAGRERALLEKTKRRYPVSISTAVESLQRNLGLAEHQRARLTNLLLSETRPPRRFGDASDIHLVLFQASRIPAEKIKPIFDEGQWQTMSQWMVPYQEGAGGEELLKRHGFIFDDVPPTKRSTPAEPATKQDGPRARTESP
jgi:hypothetical protein